jgi:hypothetical protein
LKPACDIPIGTERGFVVGHDIFPSPADPRALKPRLRSRKRSFGQEPQRVTAGAGYGGEETFACLGNKGTTAVVKRPLLRRGRSVQWREEPRRSGNGERHEDYYICPNGRKAAYRGIRKGKTPGGCVTSKEPYMGESCTYCREQELGKRGKGNRQIGWNEKWRRLKAQSRKAVENHEELRKRRSVEVETAFGQIKGSRGCRIFLPRGKGKVSAERGLFSLGYDIKRLYRINRLK